MKLSLKTLRKVVLEEVVKASPDYMKKEAVRQELQALVNKLVQDGTISSEEDLRAFFDTAPMALNALKMVPYEIWRGNKP